MATIKKTKRLKEADPLMDQNQMTAPAQPATPEDMAAAPAQPVDPAAAPIEEPATEDAALPAEGEGGVQVDPETVSMQVKVPTDQLAAAVAQSTGDMEPAEISPDAMANQEADLVSSVETGEEAAPVDEMGGAPAEGAPAEQPVMESKKVKSSKIKEAEGEIMGEVPASEAVTEHDEDKLEDIIDTAVANMGDSIGTSSTTTDGENKEDLIENGVDNMKESIEDEDENVKDEIKEAGSVDDVDLEEGDEEEADDNGIEMEDADEFDFDLSDIPGLEEGDGIDDIDSEFSDLGDPDTEEFLNNVEDFLAQEDTEEVVDALKTTAGFLSQIALKPGEKPFSFDDVSEGDEPEDLLGDDEDEDIGPDPEPEDVDADFADGDDFEDEEDDIEDDDIEARLEDFLDNDKKYEKNALYPLLKQLIQERRDNMRKAKLTEKVSNVADRKVTKVVSKQEPLKENIIYPAGSAPSGQEVAPSEGEMVRAQENISKIRRDAIRKYRKSLIQEREERQEDTEDRARFNSALRQSVQSVKRENKNSNSWESNNFTSKYKERFDYNEFLKNHYLG